MLERSGKPSLRAKPARLLPAVVWRMPFGFVPCSELQLAVELTDAGRAVAQPLLLAEQDRLRAEQRAAEVVVLPLRQQVCPQTALPATDLAVS